MSGAKTGSGRGLPTVLLLCGIGWGLTTPLMKISVSGEYRQFGLVFWQLVISGVVLAAVARGAGVRLSWTRRAAGLYLLVAFLGTILPNAASYQAAIHLPGGLMAMLISMVPIFSLPIALALGDERLAPRRLAGLALGLAGVALIALPGAALPDAAQLIWIPVALIAPAFYAIEGNVVARLPRDAPGALERLLGASVLGAPLAGLVAVAMGQWIDPRPPWGLPDAALVGSAAIHALVYTGYVWLVGRAGALFASQVAYLVTGFGVLWSMLLLHERYAAAVWIAFALILAGLYLVQPRRVRGPLVPAGGHAKV